MNPFKNSVGRSPFGGLGRALAGSVSLLFLAAALAGAAGPGPGDDTLPKAEVLLDRYVEVTGGQAAYDRLTNRVTKATFEILKQGISASFTIYNAKPNKLYLRMESEAFGTVEKGTDGDVVWEVSLMSGPTVKEGLEREEVLRDATFDKLVYWRSAYGKAECVGEATVDGEACYKIVLGPEKGKPHTAYSDRKTGLVIKMDAVVERPMGTIPVETYLGDYKEVDGVRIPHKVRVLALGQERVFTVQSVEHNVELAADRFDLPQEIRDLLEKKPAGEPEEPPGKEL